MELGTWGGLRSETIAALGGVWEVSRFPQGNCCFLFAHISATGSEERLWEGVGTCRDIDTAGTLWHGWGPNTNTFLLILIWPPCKARVGVSVRH